MCCLGGENQLSPRAGGLEGPTHGAGDLIQLLELVERCFDSNLGELRLFDVEVQMPDAGKVALNPPHLYPDAGIEPEQCHLRPP